MTTDQMKAEAGRQWAKREAKPPFSTMPGVIKEILRNQWFEAFMAGWYYCDFRHEVEAEKERLEQMRNLMG